MVSPILQFIPHLSTICAYFDKTPQMNYKTFYRNLYDTTYLVKTDAKNSSPFVTLADYQGNIAIEEHVKRNSMPEPLIVFYLLHECYHVASLYTSPSQIQIGFYQQTETSKIGRGLNEGCTQLLVCRDLGLKDFYIPIAGPDRTHYYTASPMETSLANLLGHIVGFDHLKELLLNANLYGLVEELSEYVPKTQVINFIHEMDALSQEAHDFYHHHGNIPLERYQKIVNFLDVVFDEKYKNNLLNLPKREAYYNAHVTSFEGILPKIKSSKTYRK